MLLVTREPADPPYAEVRDTKPRLSHLKKLDYEGIGLVCLMPESMHRQPSKRKAPANQGFPQVG